MRSVPVLSFLALALCACDSGVVHVVRYPNGRVKESWTEKGAAGSPTLREGLFQSFHPDGRRESSIEYRRGRKEGEAQVWDKAGHPVFAGKYHDDFLVAERRMDLSGKAVFDREYSIREEKVRVPGLETT